VQTQALMAADREPKNEGVMGTLTSRASPRSPTAVSSSRSRASRLGGLGMSGMSAPTPMPMLTARQWGINTGDTEKQLDLVVQCTRITSMAGPCWNMIGS
jgi:hypothetical protein